MKKLLRVHYNRYMYIKHYVDKNSINSSSSYILNKQFSSPAIIICVVLLMCTMTI